MCQIIRRLVQAAEVIEVKLAGIFSRHMAFLHTLTFNVVTKPALTNAAFALGTLCND